MDLRLRGDGLFRSSTALGEGFAASGAFRHILLEFGRPVRGHRLLFGVTAVLHDLFGVENGRYTNQQAVSAYGSPEFQQDMAERAGRVQTRGKLLQDVWDMPPDMNTRTVDTHVKRLREKMGDAAGHLETVRGVGYRFNATLPKRRSQQE